MVHKIGSPSAERFYPGEWCCGWGRGRLEKVTMLPILSTCPLHTNSRRGKREAHIDWSMVTCKGSPLLELPKDYWSCAGGLSAVKVVGKKMYDPVILRLTRWRIAV